MSYRLGMKTQHKKTARRVITKIKFLDMVIQDTGNSDRIVLVGEDGGCKNVSVGNFDTWLTAKMWAVRWFMVRRPDVFGHQVWQRMSEDGSGCSHEWFKFKRYCDDNGIKIPNSMAPSNDGNYLITLCGQIV